MTDYKTMYMILLRRICDATDILSSGFVQTEHMLRTLEVLKDALNRAEDVYIETYFQEEAE